MTINTIYFQSIKTSISRFDNVFDHFEQMFEADMLSNMPTFPHYNIVKTIKTSTISKSLLLFKKDIEVNLEEGVLSIKSKKDIEDTKDGEVLHKGIAKSTSQNLSQSLMMLKSKCRIERRL